MVRAISSLMLFARLSCGYSALMSAVSHSPSMSKILYYNGISKSYSKDDLLTLLHEGSLWTSSHSSYILCMLCGCDNPCISLL